MEQKTEFRVLCNEQSIFITNSTNKPGSIFIPPSGGVLNLLGGSLDSFENVMKAKTSSLKKGHMKINKMLHTCILRGFTNPSKVNIINEKTYHF